MDARLLSARFRCRMQLRHLHKARACTLIRPMLWLIYWILIKWSRKRARYKTGQFQLAVNSEHIQAFGKHATWMENTVCVAKCVQPTCYLDPSLTRVAGMWMCTCKSSNKRTRKKNLRMRYVYLIVLGVSRQAVQDSEVTGHHHLRASFLSSNWKPKFSKVQLSCTLQ